MPSPDALRASLDTHEVDRKAGRDRAYVESVLRRLPEHQRAAAKASYADAAKASRSEVPAPTQAESNGSATPSFSRVSPISHPKEEPVEEVVFKERTESKPHKFRESPVVWDDVTEGEDPDRKPDPQKGYMKGAYALFRRQVDDDHAVYFFATELADDAEQTRVPEGYEVRLTEETRLPYIARRGKASHLNQTAQVRAKDRDEAIQIAARKHIGGLHPEP